MTDTTTIERVERAIKISRAVNGPADTRAEARAAIEAMREPTVAMFEAAVEHDPTEWPEEAPTDYQTTVHNKVWQAMINFILSTKETAPGE